MAIEAESLVARLTEEADDRQKATLPQSGQKGFQPVSVGQRFVPHSDDPHAGKVAQQLAETFGTNRTYVNDVKKIKEAAPEILAAIKADEVSVADARILAKLPEPERAVAQTMVANGQARNIKQASAKIRGEKTRQEKAAGVEGRARPSLPGRKEWPYQDRPMWVSLLLPVGARRINNSPATSRL